MKLTRGMFGSEFGPAQDTKFELKTGQMRYQGQLTRGSGWYNKAGERLGWGDLTVDDMRLIQRNLESGQAFIILGETDSFWNFIECSGSMSEVDALARAPGTEYVLEHMNYLIIPEGIHRVDWKTGTLEFDGFIIPKILREDAVKLIQDL